MAFFSMANFMVETQSSINIFYVALLTDFIFVRVIRVTDSAKFSLVAQMFGCEHMENVKKLYFWGVGGRI